MKNELRLEILKASGIYGGILSLIVHEISDGYRSGQHLGISH